MKKRIVQILILIIILYFFFYFYFTPRSQKPHSNSNMKYCFCFTIKQWMGFSFSKILPIYYYLNESITLNSNGSKKLKYCEKRSKSLHYDFKETLDSLLLSDQKIFIAIMLYNNEVSLPDWFSEFQRLINFLKPINPFVSILESQSRDLTPMW